MGDDRTALKMNLGGLDDFEPRKPTEAPKPTRKDIDKVSSFPSREAAIEGQMNMKGSKAVLDRFKAMCKDDRRSYAAMLEILMDSFEEKGQGD